MSVITCINAAGVEINIDPETVDAIKEVGEMLSGLRIGGMTVAIRENASEVAARVAESRGRPCEIIASESLRPPAEPLELKPDWGDPPPPPEPPAPPPEPAAPPESEPPPHTGGKKGGKK